AQRWPSCLALVEALEAAWGSAVQQELYASLPPVIPLATLFGEPAGPDVVLPSVGALVTALTTPHPRTVVDGSQNTRYLVREGGVWEHRCPFPLLPGALPLKVEGFREHWQGRVVRREQDSYLPQLGPQVARGFWERVLGQPRHLEVELRTAPVTTPGSRLTEATVRVRVVGAADPQQRERIAATMAPLVFESLRQYLQPLPEQ